MSMSDIYGIYVRVHQFLMIEWIVLNVMAYTMKELLRSCEEFDSISENRLSFDQQAITLCN